MKLSEAIRLGAMMRPPSVEWHGCALGVAARAMGCHSAIPTHFLHTTWPWLAAKIKSPDPSHPTYRRGDALSVIEDLNGWHRTGLRWTREAIADWVATIEPQDAPVETGAACKEGDGVSSYR